MLRPDYSKSVEGNTKRQRKHNPTDLDSDLKGKLSPWSAGSDYYKVKP